MNEQENNKQIKEETKTTKQEVVTPEQTGEIVHHEVETPKAEKEVAQEVPPEDKPIEAVVEVSDEAGQNGKNVREESGQDNKDTEEHKSEEGVSDDAAKEVQSDEKQDESVEGSDDTNNEEEKKEEKLEEVEPTEDDLEVIKKELAELKAEKEEEAKVKELVEVAQHVEAEYDRVVNGINKALRETLEQYQIPTDKSIQELEKEDLAKAQIARSLIAQAKQALDYNTQKLSQEYKTKEQDVVFSKAERLFNKYEMTTEQQQVAAETFVSILQASGLQDLKEDLAAKVELSVAQAKFKVPHNAVTKEEVVNTPEIKPEPTVEPEKVDEIKPEEEVSEPEEKPEEKPSEAPAEEFKLERGVAKEPVSRKVVNNLDDYKEGINGDSSASASKVQTITPDNVLSKLASLPPKERQKFMKDNFAMINVAMRDFNIKNSRKI